MKNSILIQWLAVIFLFGAAVIVSGCSDDDPVCTTIGAPCDDGNIDTYNDVYDAICDCAGTLNRFVDVRDGQSYNTVKIGTQTWMKENLNLITPNSKCYDEIADNCSIYGRLYEGGEARAVCPIGWHLPSNSEWNVLIEYLGGLSMAGGKLKEAGEQHWSSPNTGATNESGFTALPGGWFSLDPYSVGELNEKGYWWSSTELGAERQYLLNMESISPAIEFGDDFPGAFGLSVRCVRD